MNAWADNPQAAQIDELVGRAGRLTSVECDRLATDWVAARLAARLAARVAARDASRDADWFAAWVADRVAEALAVRDLIDEATPWNREAYDLLTGPWRRAIGPVHSDDEVLR